MAVLQWRDMLYIGFNHGLLGLAENPALGPGYALGVLAPKASPSGWDFSQTQHPMIKTYNQARSWLLRTLNISHYFNLSINSLPIILRIIYNRPNMIIPLKWTQI